MMHVSRFRSSQVLPAILLAFAALLWEPFGRTLSRKRRAGRAQDRQRSPRKPKRIRELHRQP